MVNASPILTSGLHHLQVYNFKSYKGLQTIGPFHSFTSVIGPNGAGKSNLMDAISFVLGVRSQTLRSAQLKDLIYRRGRKGKGKGKGKERAEGDAAQDDDGEEDGEDEGDDDDDDEEEVNGEGDKDDEGMLDGERRAWVKAVYIDQDGKEWDFQRSISSTGSSDYRLNSKSVPYKTYNAQLESFHILVKARNFLVFQGDVEQVASQTPKDLSRLIDQISGSLDLKDEYEKASKELEKATEMSVAMHGRRKGVNGEIKQYKEMQKEAERWRSLGDEKDQAIIQHLLWKLYHVDIQIQSNTTEIEEKNDSLKTLRAEHASFDEDQKTAKKDVTKAQKDVGKQEKLVKKREKDLEDSKPELVSIDAKISHARTKLKKSEDLAKTVQKDLDAKEKKLEGLKKDHAEISRLAERNKAEIEEVAKSKGFVLSAEDLKEYHELKDTASLKAIDERSSLNTLIAEQRTVNDTLVAANDSLEVWQRKLEKLVEEEKSLSERKATFETKVKEAQSSLASAKKNFGDLNQKASQAKQSETELNEKLIECSNQLAQAGADKRESERDVKFRETLANLKRTFNGVKGRVIDLCKPTHQKYGLAVTTILGRNIDSIVVDTEKTAIACIEYLRVQRSGQATFIPLETIQAKPVADKFRTFARGARLAIDVITYDASVEKAMHHACGNGLICDTMDIARSVCYDKGQEVKAVTLEGTVIHRSGLITGGNSSANQGRQFEEQEVEGLRRRHADLLAKLGEIAKTKPRPDAIQAAKTEVTRLEAELTANRDDLNATTTRLSHAQKEVANAKKEISTLNDKIKKASKELDKIEEKIAGFKEVIDKAEVAIFAKFCKRIGVKTIREYEEKQLKTAQEGNEQTLKFDKQLAKLAHQLKFDGELVEEARSRVEGLEATAAISRESLAALEKEKEAAVAEQQTIEGDIESLQETLTELQGVLTEKSERLEEVRKQGGKTGKALDKCLKEIASCNDEIEKLASERFAVFRRCKLEEIDLPLAEGSASLDDFPIDEAAQEVPMDVDGEEETTQRAAKIDMHGVELDFDDLEEDEMENGTAEMEETLLANVTRIQAELDKMIPNRKAIEKLGDSEARFKEIDSEFDKAREAVKAAKDAFTALKKQRCDLFNKAYTHISDRIDEVYKDLTKGTMAPMGGVAYLSLEDSEEPYLHGIKYHAMPPMKRFRDMDQLSGGEKTMAALALLFAIHSFHPSPFFVLDEVDAALDNTNVSKLATYIRKLASPEFQFVVISLKPAFFQKASALVGVYREGGGSKNLTLDLSKYAQ